MSGIKQIVTPKVRGNTKHSFHLYVIRCKKRDKLVNFLDKEGISTAIHYPTALPNLPAYDYLKLKEEDYPIATKYQNQILSIPMFPELTEDQIGYIAKKIKSFYNS